jgi:hypothetical protein
MPCQHPFDSPRPAPAKAPQRPMDPRDRLRRFGPLVPMEQPRSLLDRLLFF